MESRLAEVSSLPQKDKGPAYLSLASEVLSTPALDTVAEDIRKLVETVTQDNVVVGRQVLSELAKGLSEGRIQNDEVRKQIVEQTLSTVQPRIVSYEEQV